MAGWYRNPCRSTALNVRAAVPRAGRKAVLSVSADAKKAVVVLTGTAGVSGVVTFTQDGDGPTTVTGSITGYAA